MSDPSIFRGREHSEVAIPLGLLLQEGSLNIFDEIKRKKYFQIYSRGADLIFQCGGFIGLIPINENVAVEVAPRVHISNLDRMFRKVGATHTFLTLIKRQYAESSEGSYLVALLADELIEAVSDIVDWGRHKEYEPQQHWGQPRSGRILIKETLRARAKNPGSPLVMTSRFARNVNNQFNYCIKLAIERVLSLLRRETGSKAERQRSSRLNEAWLSFMDVQYLGDATTVAIDTKLKMNDTILVSPPYKHALSLATAILLGVGPSQQNLPPSFSLGSMIFDLSAVFERYVRLCLSEYSAYPILDGNTAKPVGAKKTLFDEATHPLSREVAATPDIVVATPDRRGVLAVIDAKYKLYNGMPDRKDINQALAYAVTYGAPKSALIYPSLGGPSSVERFGSVGQVELLGLSFNLGAKDLSREEKSFASNALGALGVPTR